MLLLLMLLLLVLVLMMMLVLMLYHLIYLKVLEAQADLGLDVVTDGEMERGAYYMQVKIQDSKVYCRPNISNYMQVEYSTHYQIICSAGEIYH